MKKLSFVLVVLVLLSVSQLVFGDVIWTLDFETAGGYTTSITEFTDGSGDYYKRTNGSDISGSFNGILGTWYFAAQDIDGEGATLPVTLTIEDIDITGYSDLQFYIYFAEDDDETNQDWDEPDYVHIDYDIDNSGSFSNLIWLENDGSTFNSAPFIDSNFDGTGEGAEITNTFTEYSASISGTGSTVDIQITFNLDSGDEDIAIDNLRIEGTSTGGGQTEEVTDTQASPASGNPWTQTFTGTGVNLSFPNVTTQGDVTVTIYSGAPLDASGLSNNISNYTILVEIPGGFAWDSGDATITIDGSSFPVGLGISGAADNVSVHRRATYGSGSFTSIGSLSGSDPYTFVTSTFSEFAFTSPDEPLPIELADFNFSIIKEGVLLNWETASEIDNAGFNVYRNTTNELKTAEKLTATLIEGAGTTSEAQIYSYLDSNVEAHTSYYYWISDVASTDGKETFHGPVMVMISDFKPGSQNVDNAYFITQNYPNPFNPTTSISYNIAKSQQVSLEIYDLNGKLVKTLVDNEKSAGYYTVKWHGDDNHGNSVSSGVYVYKLTAGDSYTETKRMTLMK